MASVLQSLAATELARCLAAGQWTQRCPSGPRPTRSGEPRADRAAAGGQPPGVTTRDTFLTRIDGLMYGDDPQAGSDRGQHLHPSRAAADLHRSQRVLHGQRHQRGVDQRPERARAADDRRL